MKKVGLFLVYAIIFSFFSSNLYSTPPKITLAIEEGDFSPYTFGSKGPYRGKGAIIDLLKSFEKDIGVEFRFKIYPWKRCLSMLKKNKVDGVFNASFKKERMKFGVYPFVEGKINFMRGTHSSDYVLYKRKNSLLKWDGKKFIDLKNHIGAERGFSIISELKTLGVSVKEVGDASKGLTMTYKGRLQGFVTLESMGDFALEGLKPHLRNQLTKFSLPIKTKRYYIIFSHQFAQRKKATLEKIWESIEKANKSGQSEKLVRLWLKKME